jgi:AraC-like DNA-binding protein
MGAGKKGLTFLGVWHIPPNPDWQVEKHSHPFNELIVVFGGKIHTRINGTNLNGGPGDMLFYPAGMVHEETTEKDNPVETWYIIFEEKTVKPLPALVHDQAGRIRVLTRWLHEEYTTTPTVTKLHDALMQAIFAEWERLRTCPENAMVKKVHEYLAVRLNQKVALGELAGVVKLNKYHFGRTYRRLTGRTPMKDLQSMRAKHARYLILTTNLTQKEIAKQSGLGDVYYLSRVFKHHFGISPGALRSRKKDLQS